MRSSIIYRYSLLIFCFIILGLFLVWPIALTVWGGFFEAADGERQFTFYYILSVFRDPVLLEGLKNSLLIAITVTLLSLVISIPLSILNTRFEFRGKTFLSALLLVPLILPPFVGAIGLRQILGRAGAVNQLLINIGLVETGNPINFLGGDWMPDIFPLNLLNGQIIGIIVMEALHLYPIVYLNVTAALANLDPAMEQAAENLGASRWKRFWCIVFPLIGPGVFAGCTIVFIWAFTELGTPLMFDFTAVTPVQIFWGIQEMQSSSRPYALVVVMLTIAILTYAAGKLMFGGRSFTATTRASIANVTKKLTGVKSILVLIPFIVVITLAIIPHIGVIITSFAEPGTWYHSVIPESFTGSHYATALTHDLASGSIRNSLIYSLLAMILDIGMGLLIAYLLVRSKLWGKGILDGLSMLPLAVPGLVMAFGYVAVSLQVKRYLTGHGFAVPDILQVVGENPNPILFLVIAYAVRRLPYVVRSAVAGLEQTPYDLEEAALVLGASRMRTVRKIVMPLIIANLIAGGLLAFSFAMLEVSDSLILAQTHEHFPITKAIYVLYDRLGDGPYIASAMGVWGMALLTLTLIGASMMLGKKMGAIFRI